MLQTLVQVFKTGHRDDLISRMDKVFEAVLKQTATNKYTKKSSHIKKGKVNMAQRIGCIFLKPKLAAWRYQRGHRSLTQNLANSGVSAQIISSSGVQAPKPKPENEEMLEEEVGGEEELDDDHHSVPA
jgi:hypothetical protein